MKMSKSGEHPHSSYTHAGGVVMRPEGGRREYLVVCSSGEAAHWVLPKGHIKPGESPEEAAVREVREESGVEAQIVAPLGEAEFARGTERIRVRHFAMRYVASAGPGEGRDVRWCSYEEATRLLSFDDARRILATAREWWRSQPRRTAAPEGG